MHAISLHHCHQFLKITDDSIPAFITGHSAAAFFLMKCADFLGTVPSICVLSLWPLQASTQLEVSAAALPSALCLPHSQASSHWCHSLSLQTLTRVCCNVLTLISYYWLCFGLIFGLITTDWFWKWAPAHDVNHNRLECQWSNRVIALKYQLNVLFLLFQTGMLVIL